MNTEQVYRDIARQAGIPDPIVEQAGNAWIIRCQLKDGVRVAVGQYRTPEQAQLGIASGWQRVQSTYADRLLPQRGEADAQLTWTLLDTLSRGESEYIDERLVAAARRYVTQLENQLPEQDCVICGMPVTPQSRTCDNERCIREHKRNLARIRKQRQRARERNTVT